MNQAMMDAAQVQMEEAEALRQELIAMSSTGQPVDQVAYDAKYAEYGSKFVQASAAVAEASYAEE